jgi:GNAT superfamily N-acetyltransferase
MLLASVPKRALGGLLARLVRVQRVLFFEGRAVALPAAISEQEFVTFHAYTVPAYRGRGLLTALNRLACAHAASHGATRQIAWRKSGNGPALRVAEKLGQRCVATATAVWLFGHRVYFALDWMVDPVLDLLA